MYLKVALSASLIYISSFQKTLGFWIDARFRRDSHVLIITVVGTYHELQQMVGRSSRTRGVCHGSLFVVSEERPGKCIERLKLQGVSSLKGLEKLLQVYEKKGRETSLIKRLVELKQNMIQIKTFEDLKLHFDE